MPCKLTRKWYIHQPKHLKIIQISLPDTGTSVVCDIEGLDILYTNIDQFLNKRDDFSLAIAGNEPDIILITEILPKARCETLSSARLSLEGYSSCF